MILFQGRGRSVPLVTEKHETAVVLAAVFALVMVLFMEFLGVFRAGYSEMNPRAVSTMGMGLTYNHSR
jgi:hypothetical protein